MIEAATVVDRVISMLGHQIESVTLGKRPSGDGAVTNTTWLARVEPAEQTVGPFGNAIVDEPETGSIELYKQDQTVEPQKADRLTIADGTTFTIQRVSVKIDRHVFKCYCTKDR